jgi:hypothetical protein
MEAIRYLYNSATSETTKSNMMYIRRAREGVRRNYTGRLKIML